MSLQNFLSQCVRFCAICQNVSPTVKKKSLFKIFHFQKQEEKSNLLVVSLGLLCQPEPIDRGLKGSWLLSTVPVTFVFAIVSSTAKQGRTKENTLENLHTTHCIGALRMI